MLIAPKTFAVPIAVVGQNATVCEIGKSLKLNVPPAIISSLFLQLMEM